MDAEDMRRIAEGADREASGRAEEFGPLLAHAIRAIGAEAATGRRAMGDPLRGGPGSGSLAARRAVIDELERRGFRLVRLRDERGVSGIAEIGW